ncbi:hypothetical protein [Sporosalibacterium faouarense]|uniref:hypothetical protein n=1 Tax=Sporosalibacterium faouarense TaxID=516123 RepID=UPI00141D17B2|nr:hypothetical protein [Sporosalibacterium faouarense]MTI47906.1 hypothetical protein [Bacillota bacterium]
MKVRVRLLSLLLFFSIFFLIIGCTKHKPDGSLTGLWLGTQASMSENYNGLLDKYSVYYFHKDNKLDLGQYDYSTKNYQNNYLWVERYVEYKWIDENTIDIKYNGSNIFKVSIEDTRLILKNKDYSIEFKKREFEND